MKKFYLVLIGILVITNGFFAYYIVQSNMKNIDLVEKIKTENGELTKSISASNSKILTLEEMLKEYVLRIN